MISSRSPKSATRFARTDVEAGSAVTICHDARRSGPSVLGGIPSDIECRGLTAVSGMLEDLLSTPAW